MPEAKSERVTWEEYLAMVDPSGERWMYWDGEIFSMSGATLPHDMIERNVGGLLFVALRGQHCSPFTSNRRLRALKGERSSFPDASIVCGPHQAHPDDKHATTNPTAVFEVLSDSTEAFDRGDKFAWYRTFPSLRYVVLLSQKSRHVEVFQRQADEAWLFRAYGPGQSLPFEDMGFTLAVDDIYDGVDFTGAPTP